MTEQASVLPPADPGQDPAGLALTGSDPVAERGVSIRDVATAGQRVSIPDIPVRPMNGNVAGHCGGEAWLWARTRKERDCSTAISFAEVRSGDVVIHRWREQQPR